MPNDPPPPPDTMEPLPPGLQILPVFRAAAPIDRRWSAPLALLLDALLLALIWVPFRFPTRFAAKGSSEGRSVVLSLSSKEQVFDLDPGAREPGPAAPAEEGASSGDSEAAPAPAEAPTAASPGLSPAAGGEVVHERLPRPRRRGKEVEGAPAPAPPLRQKVQFTRAGAQDPVRTRAKKALDPAAFLLPKTARLPDRPVQVRVARGTAQPPPAPVTSTRPSSVVILEPARVQEGPRGRGGTAPPDAAAEAVEVRLVAVKDQGTPGGVRQGGRKAGDDLLRAPQSAPASFGAGGSGEGRGAGEATAGRQLVRFSGARAVLPGTGQGRANGTGLPSLEGALLGPAAVSGLGTGGPQGPGPGQGVRGAGVAEGGAKQAVRSTTLKELGLPGGKGQGRPAAPSFGEDLAVMPAQVTALGAPGGPGARPEPYGRKDGRPGGSGAPSAPQPRREVLVPARVPLVQVVSAVNAASTDRGVRGGVRVRLWLGPDGVPLYAQVLSGPKEYAANCIQAALLWRFLVPDELQPMAPLPYLIEFMAR